jgi:hypothetical protein
VPLCLLAAMRAVFWRFFMSDDETKCRIEKSKGKIREEVGKITGDKSEQVKVK